MSILLSLGLGLTSLLIIGLVELVVEQETAKGKIIRVCLLDMFLVGLKIVSLVSLCLRQVGCIHRFCYIYCI